MKRKIIFLSLLFLLIAGVVSANTVPANQLATLYHPTNGDKVVVFLKDKTNISNLFSYGYKLFDGKKNQNLGIALPNLVAVFQTSLATKLTATATSTMTLVNGTTADGSTLSGYYAFIIDEGSSNQEFVTANCTATACTDLVRGISVVDGKTSVPALKKAHGRGATVKITNYPQLTLLTNIFKGTETVDAVMSYGSAITTSSFTGLQNIVSKGYIDSIAISGSPDATTSTKGIGKISSAPSVASNPVFLNSEEVATSTGNNKVVRANASGRIDPTWLAGTESYSFNGTTTTIANTLNISATTTFSGLTKVATSTPTVAGQVVGLNANAKLPAVDGSNLTNLNINSLQKSFVATRATDAASGAVTYAHGLGYAPNWVSASTFWTDGSSQSYSAGHYSATGQNSVYHTDSSAGDRAGSATAILSLGNSAMTNVGVVTAIDATNVTITWTKTGSSTAFTYQILFIAGK